jgi:hypothetical protein
MTNPIRSGSSSVRWPRLSGPALFDQYLDRAQLCLGTVDDVAERREVRDVRG